MYIDIVPNRKSPPAVLLREGWREGKKVRKRTIANLSHWPADKIKAFRRLLKDEPLVSPGEAFAIERSLPHGHVTALLAMVRKTGLAGLISSKPCRERDLILAMIVERLIQPVSKLATTRLWHTTTLAQELGVEDADEDDLYAAMDWLLERQGRIEQKLARRHLRQGAPVFYDVTSSYYEGRTCPLMRFGYSRDGKKGKTQVVYGAMTGQGGVPVAVQVYPGNSGDPATVPDQVDKLRDRFGLSRVVLVGDRGMLTEAQVKHLKRHPGLGWISALRAPAIRKLVDRQELQLSLFDERNLAEITSEAFPGERLVVCFNPLLADERARKREDLLRAAEAQLDGLYVIRTSEPRDRLSPEDTVRTYKGLAQTERLFRSLEGLEILIRPIRHRDADRVRAHIFLCLLAAYLEWHLRRAWAPLLLDDECLEQDRKTRDPVAPAEPSLQADRKRTRRRTPDGLSIHSFETLIAELGTKCRNQCRLVTDSQAPAFQLETKLTPLQSRAFELIDAFPVPGTG